MTLAIRRCTAVVAIGLASGLLSSTGAEAQQPTPTVSERIQALAAAFEQVASRSEAGSWQAADSAFNDAVALLDALRPGLVAEAGAPADAAATGVDGLLGELVAALDAEDAAAVRAVVGLVRAQLRPVAPNAVAPGASGLATRLLLDWRSDLAVALASGHAGNWNDMRDAATDLAARIERSGPSVLAATGEGAERDLQRALVFTLRVRSAALDRVLEDASAAAGVAGEALAALLRSAAGDVAATPQPDAQTGIVFRAFTGAAEPGSATVVAILAEDIPDVGLGAFKLRVRWSSGALTLRDVAWDVGQGSSDRGGGAGTVVLTWPPAPTGPRGSTSVARLTFDVTGSAVTPRDYLPTDELAALEEHLATAKSRFLSADVPQAGAEVMAAYLGVRSGSGAAGTLWEALAERDLKDPLEGALLGLLDAVSRPAEPDVILERFELSSALLEATVQSYAAPFAAPGQVPIVVEAIEAFDTRGKPLPVRASLPANVHLSGARPPPIVASRAPATVPAEALSGPQATMAAAAGAGSAGDSSRATASPVPRSLESGNAPRRSPPLPLPLLVTLLGAAAAGGAAVLWSRKRVVPAPEDEASA